MIITAVFCVSPTNECEVKMFSVLRKSESNTWQQIRASQDRTTQYLWWTTWWDHSKGKQHRKGGNIVYHKKLTGLILLENVHHIIVTEILEKPNSVLLTSWIDGSQLYSNHTWCRVNGLNGVLGRFKTSLSSEDLQDLVWCYIFSFIKLV